MRKQKPRAFLLFVESRKCSRSLFLRISGRKTAKHFCWKCFKAMPGPTLPPSLPAIPQSRPCGWWQPPAGSSERSWLA
ncbi:hypothetical protein FS799_15035 [Agrobacterium vitis]|nr:hypothetical protein [Agrobacterium vitis]MCF1453917.1 hypothetical protein [Agrobacterium vitis]